MPLFCQHTTGCARAAAHPVDPRRLHKMENLLPPRTGRPFSSTGVLVAAAFPLASISHGLVEDWLCRVFPPDRYSFAVVGDVLRDQPQTQCRTSRWLPGRREHFPWHPRTALLIVEIADTSFAMDGDKASLYAAAGIPGYWVIDVNDRRLHLFRPGPTQPQSMGRATSNSGACSHRYRQHSPQQSGNR